MAAGEVKGAGQRGVWNAPCVEVAWGSGVIGVGLRAAPNDLAVGPQASSPPLEPRAKRQRLAGAVKPEPAGGGAAGLGGGGGVEALEGEVADLEALASSDEEEQEQASGGEEELGGEQQPWNAVAAAEAPAGGAGGDAGAGPSSGVAVGRAGGGGGGAADGDADYAPIGEDSEVGGRGRAGNGAGLGMERLSLAAACGAACPSRARGSALL